EEVASLDLLLDLAHAVSRRGARTVTGREDEIDEEDIPLEIGGGKFRAVLSCKGKVGSRLDHGQARGIGILMIGTRDAERRQQRCHAERRNEEDSKQSKAYHGWFDKLTRGANATPLAATPVAHAPGSEFTTHHSLLIKQHIVAAGRAGFELGEIDV